MDVFDKFFKTGKVSYNMLRYITGLAKVGCQSQLHSIEMKKKYAKNTYKNKKVIKFNVQLTKGHYANFQNVHLCFPLKNKPAADNYNDLTVEVITVNNFFAHWIKEIDIKRYEDVSILPLTKVVDIDRYFDEILKHVSKDTLKTIQNDLLYSKKKVVINSTNNDRLTDRIAKITETVKK